MTIDDPFAEPGDSERTVIRPNPGGRLFQPQSGGGASQPSPPPPQPRARAPEPAGRLWDTISLKNLNPLVAAAVPLLGLAVRLKNRAQHNDVEALRERVIGEINLFERAVTPQGLPVQTLRGAKYVLCALLDDLVLNTPWGSRSVWSTKSMVGTFFTETWGGDRFFDLLAQLKKDPAVNLDMLELVYFCITLGFEGKYRVMPRGGSELAIVREDLYRLIRNHRGEFERELAPHWKGAPAAHRGLVALVPTWVVAAVAAAVLAVCYAGFSFALNDRSDASFERFAALPPSFPIKLARAAPAPALPPQPATDHAQKIRRFLEPEIKQGLVTVLEDSQTITIRIRNRGMFASGSGDLVDSFKPTLLRVGEAINEEPGAVLITGHSDNVPIKSLRFPSNWHLSQARAQSVLKILAQKVTDPTRLTAEGKADSQPIASNATAEGREQNRRTEIVLIKAS
jgi:type VI secretion system protein ImpK